MNKYSVEKLYEITRQLRRDVIKMLMISKSGHTGGPLGAAEMFASLYFNVLNIDPKNPKWEDRDYFFLSAGHYAPIWYSSLARAGYFPLSELATLRKLDTKLQGHPAPVHTHGVPGVEIASGALGQGLSVAVGAALALRLDNKNSRVFVFHGDGELNEGQIWEAAMTASHHKVSNLTAIVDRNNCQIDNFTNVVMGLEPLADKWRAFGWNVLEINGHSIEEFLSAIEKTKNCTDKPSVIIAKTFMGNNVSIMHNDYKWHGVPPNDEQGKTALSEIAPTSFGDFIKFDWEKE
jgi:transketolase